MAFLLQRAVFEDIEAFTQMVSDWDLDFCQIERGPYSGELWQLVLGEAQFGYARSSRRLAQRGSAPKGFRTFALLAEPRADMTWHGQRVTGEDLAVFPRTGELSAAVPPGWEVFTFTASEEFLAEASHTTTRVDLSDLLHDRAAVFHIPSTATRLRQVFSRLRRHASGTDARPAPSVQLPELAYEVSRELVEALATGSAVRSKPPPRVRTRALERALAYIEASRSGAVSVRDLCRATGASERTLRYAFQERFGISPKAYLQAVRLNGVRRELRRADPKETTVTHVAMAYEFWHLSQFAADYRRFFGEVPSETLRRDSAGPRP